MVVRSLSCATTVPSPLATVTARYSAILLFCTEDVLELKYSFFSDQVGHERTHTEKKLECPFCEMRFGADISLRKHSKIHERQLASEILGGL